MKIFRSQNISEDGYEEILPETRKGSWRGEIINKRKDGSEFPILLSTSVIKDDFDCELALVGVAMDITDMKRAREELLIAKEKAEKSDKLKSEFLAQMSHEIRTPINAIINFISLIKEDVADKVDKDSMDGFASIDSASKRIIRTIDLILNMSEIQTGTFERTPREFDLYNNIIKNLMGEFHEQAKLKGLDLNIRKQADQTNIFADEYSVSQIFINLIDNAIKYTKQGKVKICINRSEKKLLVEVRDTGIGISKEYLPHLFDPFSQEEQGYSRSFEGVGLGLALVKKYCEINKADIEIESEKNKGSVFRVIFTE